MTWVIDGHSLFMTSLIASLCSAPLPSLRAITWFSRGRDNTIYHEHMNRDWESQLNCLYFDDTKLKKEEGS
jgi:hypothetical protein